MNLSWDDVVKEVDRISKLPDDVIGRILSLLPTKHAVGTSVLSTSWGRLWTAIRDFYFDDLLLFNPQKYDVDRSLPSTEYRRELFLRRPNFINFIHHVFSRTNGSVLSSFYIRIRHPIETEEFEHLNEWLHEALSRSVRLIDVRIPCFLFYHVMPRTLLLDLVSRTNLEVLKLGRDFNLEIPHGVSLPNLKILHLYGVFISGVAANRLLSSCPRLEDLTFDFVSLTDMCGLNISAPALKHLDLFILPVGKGFKIDLETPRLTVFSFCDESADSHYSDLFVKCPHAIIKAKMDMMFHDVRSPEPVIYLLYSLAEKVQILSLSCRALKVFVCSYRRWPQFLSLTSLEFKDMVRFDLVSLGCLLNSAVNLQSLAFKQSFLSRKFGSKWFREERLWIKYQTIQSHFFRLKEIYIGYFTGDETEFEGLDFLLKKAIALEKLEIRYSSRIDQTKVLSFTDRLLKLPIPSKCELLLLNT